MKIFVSGQIKDIENVHKVQAKLIKAGHTMTHDWTAAEGNKPIVTTQEKLEDTKETGSRAVADIKGVVECDVFIICTNNLVQGKGMYAELGAALALNATTGRPKIFLVGAMNHLSVFYLHPVVVHADSIDGVIEKLKG